MIVGIAGVVGCAGGPPLSGGAILADLERDGVRLGDGDRRIGASQEAEAAQLPESGPIELTDLLRVAEARSPALAASRSEVGMAAGALWQASLYPNPRLDVEVEDVSTSDGFSTGKTTVGITQPIVLGGRVAAAMEEAAALRGARLAEVDAERLRLFGDIALEYVRATGAAEQRRLLMQMRELAARAMASSQERFDARAAPETEVIRPRVELHRLDAALARVEQDERSSRRRLELLIGDVPIEAARLGNWREPALEPLTLHAMEAAVRASHPALRAADREVEAAAAGLERERAERVGDLDVRFAGGYRAAEDDGVVEFGAAAPLPVWDGQDGDILAARFALMRARQLRTSLEHALLAELATAAGEHEAARAQLSIVRERLEPDSARVLERTRESYNAGSASFMDLLDAQRTYTEARLASLELSLALAMARARALQIVGPEFLEAAPGSPGSAEASQSHQVRPQGAEAVR